MRGHVKYFKPELKLCIGKDKQDRVLTLAVDGIEGARIEGDRHEWLVKSGEVYAAAVAVDVPAGAVRGGRADLPGSARAADPV